MIDKTYPITEKLLSNGCKLTQRLFEVLIAEADSLKQNIDPGMLTRIADHKKETVAQLDQFSKQLAQVLATEQLSVDPTGMQTYLTKASATGLDVTPARQSWQTIMTLSPQCRSLNDQNGAGIALLARHTQRALQILKGKSHLNTTYGPDGTTRSQLFSHTLVSV